MKYRLLISMFVVSAVAWFILVPFEVRNRPISQATVLAGAPVSQRFELIHREATRNRRGSLVSFIEVWHDDVSGIEFVCATTVDVQGNQVSCFQIQPAVK